MVLYYELDERFAHEFGTRGEVKGKNDNHTIITMGNEGRLVNDSVFQLKGSVKQFFSIIMCDDNASLAKTFTF